MTNKKQTVLVVDDTPANIDILLSILSKDYSVVVATNGLLALKLAGERLPDLILLDVMMPGMSGHEVCRELKANESTRHIPVIFVTGMNDIQDEVTGFKLGADDYIVKPVSPPVVLARVKAHTALSNHRQHLEELVGERTKELERSNYKLKQTYLDMLLQLGRAAEYRDNETGKHVIRVGKFSALMGLAFGLSDDQSEMLMYASMMHDIGKIGTPDHILLKPGKLTPEEFDIIKEHPEIGAGIIGEHEVEVLQMARQVALTHHEKWNGQGYPHQLSGEAIPLVGRIVAIVDVFDALTSVRPYKAAWTIEKALELIISESGKHFDPRLVELFLGLETEVRKIAVDYSDAG